MRDSIPRCKPVKIGSPETIAHLLLKGVVVPMIRKYLCANAGDLRFLGHHHVSALLVDIIDGQSHGCGSLNVFGTPALCEQRAQKEIAVIPIGSGKELQVERGKGQKKD